MTLEEPEEEMQTAKAFDQNSVLEGYIAQKISFRGELITEETDFGSGNDRMSPATLKKIRKYKWFKQKGRCELCGNPLSELQFFQIKTWLGIHVHHKDGKAYHNKASNLCLAHAECHWDENARIQSSNVLGVGKRIEKETNVHPPVHTESDPVATASKILDLNVDYVPTFRKEVFEDMLESSKNCQARTRSELRVNGMTFSGCSREASYSYIEPFFSTRFGPFVEKTDIMNGLNFVDWFDKSDRKLTVDQLMQKYPREGIRVGKV